MSATLDAVPHRFLRDEAYRQLRAAIVSGRLAPGQQVVIDELARQLNLSTMPVREAIGRLVRDGLMVSPTRRSHRVTKIPAGEAADLAEVMETVTMRVYELGTPRITAPVIDLMRVHAENSHTAMVTNDLPGALRSIEAFHAEVFVASGNPEYQRFLAYLIPRFERAVLLRHPSATQFLGPDVSRTIVTRLDAGDASGAVDAVRIAWSNFRRHLADAGAEAVKSESAN